MTNETYDYLRTEQQIRIFEMDADFNKYIFPHYSPSLKYIDPNRVPDEHTKAYLDELAMYMDTFDAQLKISNIQLKFLESIYYNLVELGKNRKHCIEREADKADREKYTEYIHQIVREMDRYNYNFGRDVGAVFNSYKEFKQTTDTKKSIYVQGQLSVFRAVASLTQRSSEMFFKKHEEEIKKIYTWLCGQGREPVDDDEKLMLNY